MTQQKSVKLNLGCGETYLEGWTNIDAPQAEGPHDGFKTDLVADISTLKYPPGTVDEILMNAVFEHFQRHEALRILRNFYNWLKDGGKVTIVVPDFWGSVRKLEKSRGPAERAFWYRHLFGPQDDARYGNHLDGFDRDRLKEIFGVAGFTDLKIEPFGDIPCLRAEATKHLPALADFEFKEKAANYLIYHEYGSVPGSCFAAWLKDLDIDSEEIGFTPPNVSFPTQKGGLKANLNAVLRKVMGTGYYDKLKRSYKEWL